MDIRRIRIRIPNIFNSAIHSGVGIPIGTYVPLEQFYFLAKDQISSYRDMFKFVT
jgi:hypothetical protein